MARRGGLPEEVQGRLDEETRVLLRDSSPDAVLGPGLGESEHGPGTGPTRGRRLASRLGQLCLASPRRPPGDGKAEEPPGESEVPLQQVDFTDVGALRLRSSDFAGALAMGNPGADAGLDHSNVIKILLDDNAFLYYTQVDSSQSKLFIG